MTQMQLISVGYSILKLMQKNGMRVKDVENLEMVMKADEMVANGDQKCYIVQHLADKYGISVRSVYNAIDRLHRDIVE